MILDQCCHQQPCLRPADCPVLQVTWRLEAADFVDVDQGKHIQSEIGPLNDRLRFRFYPCGEEGAPEGKCSFFIGLLKLRTWVDVVCHVVVGTSEPISLDLTLASEKGWASVGRADFGPTPDLTRPLVIRITFTEKHILQEKVQRHEMIGRNFHEAMLHEGRRAGAAVKIQSLSRGIACRQLAKAKRAEQARKRRQAREWNACLRLQVAWRLYKKRLQRRWQRQVSMAQCSPYDAILAFDSLAQFLKTGEIQFLQQAESQFEVARASRFRIVAVVGLFDKGKTWLTNKLFGVNLPSGKLHTTKGLSFLWIEERRMLILDSAGVQSTVSYRAQAVDAILDAQTTESLMFEMISRIAHHMVFVVNDLTWFEQKYVAMLHQKYVQGGQQKELVVVHNLRNTTNVEEACRLFKRQVTRCYDGEQSHLGDLIFIQDAGPGAPPLHHIGLCNESSKAGDKFNERNRQHLLQSLEHRNSLGSELVLTDVLKAELSQLLPRFVNIEAKSPESAVCASDQAISVEFGDAQNGAVENEGAAAEYTCVGSLCLKLSEEGARVAMKTRGVISPLGEIIAHDVSFDPIVNVFDRATEGGTLRQIRIECPGVTEDDVEWEELPNGVKISIDKKRPINEHAVHPVEPIRQHHGVWEREFDFDHSDGRFEFCPDEFDLENGVLTVTLKKSAQPRRGKLGRAREGTSIPTKCDPDAKAPSPARSVCSSFAVV